MAPWLRVAIEGASMEPSLRPGEWWMARRTPRIRPGDAVVIRQPEGRGLLIVKRAVRREAGGWWVEGDNLEHSRDSRHFGPVLDADIVGRLSWRYRPLPPHRARRRPSPMRG